MYLEKQSQESNTTDAKKELSEKEEKQLKEKEISKEKMQKIQEALITKIDQLIEHLNQEKERAINVIQCEY